MCKSKCLYFKVIISCTFFLFSFCDNFLKPDENGDKDLAPLKVGNTWQYSYFSVHAGVGPGSQNGLADYTMEFKIVAIKEKNDQYVLYDMVCHKTGITVSGSPAETSYVNTEDRYDVYDYYDSIQTSIDGMVPFYKSHYLNNTLNYISADELISIGGSFGSYLAAVKKDKYRFFGENQSPDSPVKNVFVFAEGVGKIGEYFYWFGMNWYSENVVKLMKFNGKKMGNF